MWETIGEFKGMTAMLSWKYLLIPDRYPEETVNLTHSLNLTLYDKN